MLEERIDACVAAVCQRHANAKNSFVETVDGNNPAPPKTDSTYATFIVTCVYAVQFQVCTPSRSL